MLQEICKVMIHKQILQHSLLSMYLAMSKLPLPRKLIKFIWEIMEEEVESQVSIEFQDMWDSPY